MLILTMGAILAALGYCGGEALLGEGGGVLGALLAMVILIVQLAVYFGGAQQLLLGDAVASELHREESPRLFNIVEEMKLASGLPAAPKILLINDPAPNAFAIGRTPETSAIGVTTGLMHRLNRDELQGVIAHEVAHLNNHDTRFMMLAAVMLGSIAVMAEVVRRGIRLGSRGKSRSDSRGGGQAAAIFMIIALLLAILGPLAARLLYFACSRKREFLADACAAQFTRYPEGLASALEKIAIASGAVAFANEANAPMFILSPLQATAEDDSICSTHPSTAERVKILRSMGAASLNDYEAAYQQVRGRHLVGERSLDQDRPQEKRSPAGESPLWSREEAQEVVSRMAGFIRIQCKCGADIGVPPAFERPEIRCIRCGRARKVPAAGPIQWRRPEKPAPEADAAQLAYQRLAGEWESFRCACGQTVQLSPAFAGSHVNCSRCGIKIEILASE